MVSNSKQRSLERPEAPYRLPRYEEGQDAQELLKNAPNTSKHALPQYFEIDRGVDSNKISLEGQPLTEKDLIEAAELVRQEPIHPGINYSENWWKQCEKQLSEYEKKNRRYIKPFKGIKRKVIW